MSAANEYNYLKGWCKGSGLMHATKALAFIQRHHAGQERNDGSPYYAHPVKVAQHLASLELFTDKEILDTLLTSALLHDILEDTSVTHDVIVNEFSGDIAEVVRLLTKTKDLSNEDYYKAIRGNLLASLVKIADRCHNVSTMLGVFSKARLVKYIKETNELVRPLARHIRDYYPEVSNKVTVINFHIKTAVTMAEIFVQHAKDDEA